MADNEKLKKAYPPRRNPQQNRPTPGVQKAIQTFGVRDLREILDKKRQEQGESQGDKRPDPKLNLPPPDPSYNYLKDPIRDKPKPPQKKTDHDRQYERPVAKDRETNIQQHRYRDDKRTNRNREPQENVEFNRDRQQENREYERPVARDREIQQHRYKDDKRNNRDRETVIRQQEQQHGRDSRQQENKENSNVQEKGVLRPTHTAGAPVKELRFSDTPLVEGESQFTKGRRGSFRGRSGRRGGGFPREMREGKIENPVNIKIELSTETGQRNCTLDENTKIPDIKHIPDKFPYQKSSRGGFRGGRSSFRGRSRGRSGFRGRGAPSYRGKGTDTRGDAASYRNAFNMEQLQDNLPDVTGKDNLQAEDNGNKQVEENNHAAVNENEILDDSEDNVEHFDEYDQENEEYNDANENYDEFSSEYYTEYPNDDSSEHPQDLDNSSLESDKYDQGVSNTIDPNIKGTITITSSKFQDEVTRSVEVVPNVDEKERGSQVGTTEQEEGK